VGPLTDGEHKALDVVYPADHLIRRQGAVGGKQRLARCPRLHNPTIAWTALLYSDKRTTGASRAVSCGGQIAASYAFGDGSCFGSLTGSPSPCWRVGETVGGRCPRLTLRSGP